MLAWRGRLWQDLPPCMGMPDFVWLISQAAGDATVLLSFYLINRAPEFDLYAAETARISAVVASTTPAFLGEEQREVTLPESTLPACARSQLKEYSQIILEYADLTSAAGEIDSFADLLAFGQRQFEWREERLSHLPRCAEAFELGLLIDQSTSDVISGLALQFSGVDYDDLPQTEAMGAGSALLSALVTPIIEGERAAADSPPSRPLPNCSDADLATLNNEIAPAYFEAMAVGDAATNVDAILRFSQMYIDFRESLWNRLPACSEAYDIAWLMYRIAGDRALTLSLKFLGAEDDDIPHLNANASNLGRLYMQMSVVAEAPDSVKRKRP